MSLELLREKRERLKRNSESIKENLIPANIPKENLKFVIGVNEHNCTGCGLCTYHNRSYPYD